MRYRLAPRTAVVDCRTGAPARRAIRRQAWWIADHTGCAVHVSSLDRIIVTPRTRRQARMAGALAIDAIERRMARSLTAAGRHGWTIPVESYPPTPTP